MPGPGAVEPGPRAAAAAPVTPFSLLPLFAAFVTLYRFLEVHFVTLYSVRHAEPEPSERVLFAGGTPFLPCDRRGHTHWVIGLTSVPHADPVGRWGATANSGCGGRASPSGVALVAGLELAAGRSLSPAHLWPSMPRHSVSLDYGAEALSLAWPARAVTRVFWSHAVLVALAPRVVSMTFAKEHGTRGPSPNLVS